MSFAASVKANSQRMLREVNTKVFELAQELFAEVVRRTPSPSNPGDYAVGYLANQWYPEINSFSEELGPDVDTSPTGADSLARIQALYNSQTFFGRDGFVSLTNNTHYAYRAEVLGWPQTDDPRWVNNVGPYRMVAMSIQYFKSIHP